MDSSSTPSSTPFSLQGADSGFGSRSRGIFECLETIEAKHSALEAARSRLGVSETEGLLKEDPSEEEATSFGRSSAVSSHGRGGGGGGGGPSFRAGPGRGFKRPMGPPPRSRVPEFHKHPEKWTAYDLSTVSSDDLSEGANRAAALDFLMPSTKKQRTNESEATTTVATTAAEAAASDGGASSDCDRHVFSRPHRPSGRVEGPSAIPAFEKKHGCHVMPEYSVGQKPSGKKQTAKTNTSCKPAATSDPVTPVGGLRVDINFLDSEDADVVAPGASEVAKRPSRDAPIVAGTSSACVDISGPIAPAITVVTEQPEAPASASPKVTFKSRKSKSRSFVRSKAESNSDSDGGEGQDENKAEVAGPGRAPAAGTSDDEEDDVMDAEGARDDTDSLSSTVSSMDSDEGVASDDDLTGPD